MSRYYISDYVVTLNPYKAINKTVMANREPTAHFHSISNYDFFVWMQYYAARDTISPNNIALRMTGRGFTRSIDCTCWLGTESCRKLVTVKTLLYVLGTGPEINTMRSRYLFWRTSWCNKQRWWNCEGQILWQLVRHLHQRTNLFPD